MHRDVVAGIAFVCLAVLYWLGADAIPRSPLDGQIGASGLPKTLAWGLGGLAVWLIVQGAVNSLRNGVLTRAKEDGQIPGAEVAAHRESRRKHLRATGMLALGIAYLLLVPYLGYMVSVCLLMFTVALYNGAKLSPQLIGISVAGTIFFYVLFVRILNIPLPAGFWPSLV